MGVAWAAVMIGDGGEECQVRSGHRAIGSLKVNGSVGLALQSPDHPMAGWADLACSLAVLLPFLGGGGVEMADGDGERVGGVGGFGNLIEIQQARHHLLDLMFFGAAVSDYRGLDGEWRVFGDFESGGSGGQHGDTAYLAEF